MADGGPDNLHPSRCVRFLRRVDGMFTDMREALEKWDVANDRLVIRPLHVRRDDNRIDTRRMVRSDHQWTAGRDILHTLRLMRFDKARQQPAGPGGDPTVGNRAVQPDPHSGRGAHCPAEHQTDQSLRAVCLGEGEGFGQIEDQGFTQVMDITVLQVHHRQIETLERMKRHHTTKRFISGTGTRQTTGRGYCHGRRVGK